MPDWALLAPAYSCECQKSQGLGQDPVVPGMIFAWGSTSIRYRSPSAEGGTDLPQKDYALPYARVRGLECEFSSTPQNTSTGPRPNRCVFPGGRPPLRQLTLGSLSSTSLAPEIPTEAQILRAGSTQQDPFPALFLSGPSLPPTQPFNNIVIYCKDHLRH